MTSDASLSSDDTVDLSSPVRKWKPYPAYKDSGVEWLGEIPAHWYVKLFKRIANVRYGLGQPPPELPDGVPFIRATNIKNGSISDESMLYIDPSEIPKRRDAILSPREIIIVRSGAYTGDSAIIPHKYAGAIAGYDMVVAIKNDFPHFFAWQLLTPEIRDLQFNFYSLRSAQPHLNAEELKNIVLLVPPVVEQCAISDFLDCETSRIDILVAKKERLIELLQEKRTTLISHAVTKGLDRNVAMKDSGIEWLGKIPAHWKVSRLKTLTSFVTSGSRGWAQHYSDNGATFLRIGNLSRTSIDLDLRDIQHVSPPQGAEGERTRVHRYDVLISITAYIGSVAVVADDIGEAYVNQHIALTRPRQTAIAARWLGYSLFSAIGQSQFRLLLYGGTKDGLGLDDVINLFVLVPPISEQCAIATFIDRETIEIDALIAKINKAIERLREYHTALISAAVTGKIDVRNVGAGFQPSPTEADHD